MTMRVLSQTAMLMLLAGLVQAQATKDAAHESKPPVHAAGATATLNEAVGLMTGAFSSAAQAATDKDYFDIRLHMVPIWPSAKDGTWLYVEQAMSSVLARPYRQRIYHVTLLADGSIQSEVYMLPGDPLKFAGAWQKPEMLDALKPEELKHKDGCAVVLKKGEDGAYSGGTKGKGCASDLRGAAYATSEVRMDAKGLVTWDRGYDKEDTQVWGAQKGGYHFKRVSVEESLLPPTPPAEPKVVPPAPTAPPPPVPEAPKPMKPELVHPPQDLVPPGGPK